ncbi:MAG TPA: hypothetical protein VFO69_09900 [Allosphingosinicella sp.]|nr:hypothetical protein [Allosphingosinicella sp.]
MARVNAASIWTPLFALRLSIFVFLCVGSLVPVVLGEEVETYVRRTYNYSDQELAKVLLVWCVSSAVLITTAFLTSRFDRGPSSRLGAPIASHRQNTLKIGLAFLIPGLFYTLAYELPTLVGWYELTLPGSLLKLLQAAQAVGFFLVALWAMERGGLAHLAYLLPLLLTVVITLVTFNKFISVFALLFVSLAIIYKGVTWRRIVIVTATLLLTFAVLKPMISHARAVHVDTYGSFFGGTLQERFGYSLDFLAGERFEQERATSPFARLTFTAPAAYVIARHDLGLPSQSIEQSAWTLIPRFIWPDKPVVSSAGRDLYILITGRDNSQLAMTAFADLYWNLGWYGIFGVLSLFGILLWKATSFSFRIVAQRDWLLMPFALLCFEIGLSIDGAFVASVITPTAIALLAMIGLKIATGLIVPQRRPNRWPGSTTAAP